MFFDGNNGDTCDIEDYTLGWVEVVAIYRRCVYLSPIYSPQERPFVPKSLEDLPVRAREDVIDPKCLESERHHIPDSVIKRYTVVTAGSGMNVLQTRLQQ